MQDRSTRLVIPAFSLKLLIFWQPSEAGRLFFVWPARNVEFMG